MTNTERFDAIETALRNFKGVSDDVQTMQTKDILELFRRAWECESLDRRVKTLEENKWVKGLVSGESPQAALRLAAWYDRRHLKTTRGSCQRPYH